MPFTLRTENLKVRYSPKEQRLFALLPQDGALVTSTTLTKKYYGRRLTGVFNARQVVVGALSSLIRKIEFNKEPFRIKKTQRTGPIPMKFWLEKRR